MEVKVPIDNYVVIRVLERLRGYYIRAQIDNIEAQDSTYVVTGRYRRTGLFGFAIMEEGTFELEFSLEAGRPILRRAKVHVATDEEVHVNA